MLLIVKVILTILGTIYISLLVNLGQRLWGELPIEEEKSTPLYITKELKNDGTF